jgi:hypothetical protein
MSSDSATPGRTPHGKGKVQSDVPPCPEPSRAQPDAPPRPERCNVLILSFLSLGLIGFGVWLVSAGNSYREKYAQAKEGWHVGVTRMVELTLVSDDKRNLACASDQVIAGLRCGYRGDLREAGPLSPGDPQILQPYNTTTNDLLLGARLWSSSDLKEPLPQSRFTVVCNYHIEGVMKSASIRFDLKGPFGPLGAAVPVGALTDCVIPR